MPQALTHWLEALGIANHQRIYHNPDRSELISQAVVNNEGLLTHEGALGVVTTPYTGRSPDDKYIVDHQKRNDLWWGNVNKHMPPRDFQALKKRITAYLNNRHLYIVDCFIGADIDYRLSIRIVTEYAWQALAAQNLFIYNETRLATEPDIVIIAAPGFNTNPDIDHTRSNAAICIDLDKKMVLIAGSKYAGEIKKSAFTIMNAVLPDSGVLPMHCSANMGSNGDVALYFGLSGTGKTTLSTTPDRKLIGDDEHGWGENGIFNFEGGCYAKTIRLDPDLEPVIWNAATQYGTILENVFITADDRKIDFNSASLTENTRAAYPLSMVPNWIPEGIAGHPENIFLLTADAFGVLPPIAKLDNEQAIYYFLSGYTSKLAGTERGLGQKPIATFSTCFAEPFLPLTPDAYADLFRQKIDKHKCKVWLLNTGWTGGSYNTGERMPLPYTRRMVEWILSGEYVDADYHPDPYFTVMIPDEIEGIPADLLHPERTWQDRNAFKKVVEALHNDFDKNFSELEPFLEEPILT